MPIVNCAQFFLTLSRSGKPLRAPMPRFHMIRSDAEAVVAYLKHCHGHGADEPNMQIESGELMTGGQHGLNRVPER